MYAPRIGSDVQFACCVVEWVEKLLWINRHASHSLDTHSRAVALSEQKLCNHRYHGERVDAPVGQQEADTVVAIQKFFV